MHKCILRSRINALADWPCFLPAWSIAGTPGNQHSAGRSVVIRYDDVKPVVAKPDHRRAFECGDKHEGPSTPLLELQHDGLRPRINDEAFALALVIGAAPPGGAGCSYCAACRRDDQLILPSLMVSSPLPVADALDLVAFTVTVHGPLPMSRVELPAMLESAEDEHLMKTS